jgi:hypothetical protein
MFGEEYKALIQRRELSRKSELLPLNPQLGEDGIMQCDGRLANAKYLSHDVSFPIILPRKSCVTELIVKKFHEDGNHSSGTRQLLCEQLST